MRRYIAQKITLDTKKECSNRSCRCYADKGYQIRYKNCNVDSILFVCEECFYEQYRLHCRIRRTCAAELNTSRGNAAQGNAAPSGAGQGNAIQGNTVQGNAARLPAIQLDHPKLRSIIRGFNKTIRRFRYAYLPLMVVVTIVFWIWRL